MGRLVYGYADEIFSLGRDLVDALEHRPTRRPLRLAVGIDDVVPKEIAHRLLEPALALKQPVRIVCHEGTLERLVADLAVHELDLVLSDAPITPSLHVRAYSHHLGTCEEAWMATPRPGEDSSGVDFRSHWMAYRCCLPTDDTAIRRALDQWFDRQNVRPVVVGEFEDYALMREFARAGHGFIRYRRSCGNNFAVSTAFSAVGPAAGVDAQFFAISVERKIKHPAVAAIVEHARHIFTT